LVLEIARKKEYGHQRRESALKRGGGRVVQFSSLPIEDLAAFESSAFSSEPDAAEVVLCHDGAERMSGIDDRTPAKDAIQIDRICDESECLLGESQAARIEDFLGRVDEDLKSRLLFELLQVEFSRSRDTSEEIDVTAYMESFPDDEQTIQNAMSHFESNPAHANRLKPGEVFANKTVSVSPVLDVFALGIILYELILGRRPYRNANDTVRFVDDDFPKQLSSQSSLDEREIYRWRPIGMEME
jgi:hypothetical protein